VKSRRLRWVEHATKIWNKMSARKTVGSPRTYWEGNVETHLNTLRTGDADMRF